MVFKKGNIPWNKGLKGIHLSPKTEFKKGQVSLRKGVKMSEEQKKKISEAHKGKKGYWKGKRRISMEGKNNPNYTGLPTYKGLRWTEWMQIRQLILERDNYTCQRCGLKENGQKFDIHHIKPWMLSKDNSLNNLITLCRSCHLKVERRGENLWLTQ